MELLVFSETLIFGSNTLTPNSTLSSSQTGRKYYNLILLFMKMMLRIQLQSKLIMNQSQQFVLSKDYNKPWEEFSMVLLALISKPSLKQKNELSSSQY